MMNLLKLLLLFALLPTGAAAQTRPSYGSMVVGPCGTNVPVLGGGSNSPSNCGPTATRAGDVLYWNGTTWTNLAGNNSGTNFLSENASGVPSWAAALLPANNLSDVTTPATAFNNIAPTATRAGDLVYWNGTTWTHLSGNNSGTQVASENSSGVPSWLSDATTVNSQSCALGGSCTVTVAIGSGVTGLGTGVASALANNASAANGFPLYTFGAWTPAVTASSTAGTPSYNFSVGSYEETGRLVTVRFTVSLSGWTGSPSGNVSITGLPVASSNTSNDYGSCSLSVATGASLTAGVAGYVIPNTSAIVLDYPSTNNNVTAAQLGTLPILFGVCNYHT